MNSVFVTWMMLYVLAVIAISPWGFRRRVLLSSLTVVCLGVLIFQLRHSAALGDSGFYLGQAKSQIDTGEPTYPLANLRSAAISGVVMNLVTSYLPIISNFYSPIFVIPCFAIIGRKNHFQTILFLCSTATLYFLKPNYMDFYPVAIAAGSIAMVFHFRTFNHPRKLRVGVAGATAGIAIASHLILLMIPIAYVVHLFMCRCSWRKKIAQVIEYVFASYFVFRLSLFVIAQMNWPMYPGNSTGGGDNKYLATDLLQIEQTFHGLKVVCVTLLGPLVFLLLSRTNRSFTKYLPFMSSLTGIYVCFLFIYGFDLGLVPDLDLQLFPAAVIVSAILIIASREKVLLTWKYGRPRAGSGRKR